jgi:hypothetical protein
MESNECVCINYFVKMIEGMINSLLSTTGMVRMNSNTPATDSGYTSTNTGISTFSSTVPSNTHGGSLLTTGFYSILIVIALSMILMGLKKKASSLKK